MAMVSIGKHGFLVGLQQVGHAGMHAAHQHEVPPAR